MGESERAPDHSGPAQVGGAGPKGPIRPAKGEKLLGANEYLWVSFSYGKKEISKSAAYAVEAVFAGFVENSNDWVLSTANC